VACENEALAAAGCSGHGAGALSAGLGTVIEVDRPDVFRFPATKLQLHPDTGDIGVKWHDFITLDPRKAASGRVASTQLGRTCPLGQSGLRARRHRPRHRCAAGTVPNGADPLMRLFVTL
jgi:hypothetical protein